MFKQVAKAVSMALNNCVNSMPGLRQVDHAVKQIDHISHRLTNPTFPTTDRSVTEVQVQLNNAAEHLNRVAGDVVSASRQSPQKVRESAYCPFQSFVVVDLLVGFSFHS